MTATVQSVFEEWGYLYDSGGPSGNYSNNENKTFSIQLNLDEVLRLCILNNNLENPYDSLIIRANGYSFSYVGIQTDTLYLFDHITGNVDIQFKSNGVNTAPGFAIRWDKMWDSASTAPADPAPIAGWYFIPDKKTMLGGMNLFNSWNRNNVGNYSFSYGKGAVVKGDYSVAFGLDVLSEGGSFVWGFASTAKGGNFVAGERSSATNGGGNFILGRESSITGSYSYAFGAQNTVSSNNSSAIGNFNINSVNETYAFGQYNQAKGYHSMVMGFGAKTSGVNSIALGMLSEAKGENSTAFGLNTIAAGNYSTTIGSSVTATGYASTVIGEYNDSLITSQSSPTTSTPAFIIGNGTANNQRSNAFLVLRTGRVHIDPQNKNNGNLDSNAILFGLYNATGEGISSKRTVGGNQYGIDFYTGGNNRLAITNGGTIQVTNNLTVQNGKGIIRNTDGTQSKKVSTTVTINTSFTAGQTLTFPITWPETFSSTPEAFVGNVTSGAGGWAEVVMTISGAGASGATLYVYNPKTVSVSPNFTLKIIAIGPQ
jgi:Head domain of trimeric autotransporter adhesin